MPIGKTKELAMGLVERVRVAVNSPYVEVILKSRHIGIEIELVAKSSDV